jgi:hypothetical protein
MQAPLSEPLAEVRKSKAIRGRLAMEIASLAKSPEFRGQSEVSEEFRLRVVRAAIALYLLDKLDHLVSSGKEFPLESSRVSAEITSFLETGLFEKGASEIREGFLDLRSSIAPHSRKLRMALIPPDIAVKIYVPRLSQEIDSINGL